MSRTPEDHEKHGSGKKTKSSSLRAFLSRLIWVCMLPLLLLTVYLAVDRVQSLKFQCRESATNFVHLAANSIDSYLDFQIKSLKALAASPLFDDPPRLREAHKQAEGFRENFGTHVLLLILAGRWFSIRVRPLRLSFRSYRSQKVLLQLLMLSKRENRLWAMFFLDP